MTAQQDGAATAVVGAAGCRVVPLLLLPLLLSRLSRLHAAVARTCQRLGSRLRSQPAWLLALQSAVG